MSEFSLHECEASLRKLAHFSRCFAKQKQRQIPHCSRICSGQSIQEPQGSTGIGWHTVSNSIKSTYFHSISPGFHKCSDLLWEQRVGGSNPSAAMIVKNLREEPPYPRSRAASLAKKVTIKPPPARRIPISDSSVARSRSSQPFSKAACSIEY